MIKKKLHEELDHPIVFTFLSSGKRFQDSPMPAIDFYHRKITIGSFDKNITLKNLEKIAQKSLNVPFLWRPVYKFFRMITHD